jgi:hypothetical protein
MPEVAMEGLGLRAVASRFIGDRAARRDPVLASIEASLRPGERVEATAYCSFGMGEAGIAALTDHRIVFATRQGTVRTFPCSQVRAVHEEGAVGTQRRIRVALTGAPSLHLLTRLGSDLCEIFRRRTGVGA